MPFGGGDDTRGSAATPAPALAAEMPARGSAGSSMGGRQKEARPGPREPRQPRPRRRGTAGSGCCVALRGASRRRAAGGCPGRGTLERVSPEGSSVPRFVFAR